MPAAFAPSPAVRPRPPSPQPACRRSPRRAPLARRPRAAPGVPALSATPPASASPDPAPASPDSASPPPSSLIPGTPCFTPRIMSSPMPPPHRALYLHAAAEATATYLSALPPGPAAPAQLTLLAPQLNPELDIYDRRFLLQLVWAVVDVTAASANLRTRVLVQGARAFGAIPLSVAGLRRMLDADLHASREAWPEGAIRSGFLENDDDLDDGDEIVIVISPTNAVSIPVISSLVDMVGRADGRPVILLNPRLGDIPSHSGVMQVAGRAERLSFMEAIDDIFYFRLLFSAGTMYPVRGILYRAYAGPWQVWRAENDDLDYRLISESADRPSSAEITSAFSVDKYARQRKRLERAKMEGTDVSIEALLMSPPVILVLGVGLALSVGRVLGADIGSLLHALSIGGAS